MVTYIHAIAMWIVVNTCLLLIYMVLINAGEYRRVCYVTNWSQYRPGDRSFNPADITRPELCTHYIFAFAKVNADEDTMEPYEWNDDIPGGNFQQITNLKNKYPDLKILLAVGGWTHGSMPFVEIVSNDTKVDRFCDNVLAYLRDRNFDGIDLDWEYPAHRGSNDTDRERFTYLVETMMTKFKEESAVSGKSRLLITASVPAPAHIVVKAYEVDKLATSMDFVNLMAYDLDTNRDGLYYLAPLWSRPEERPPNDTLNVNASVNVWISLGMPREKIVVGIPLYGRQHTVQDGSQYQFGENLKENTTSLLPNVKDFCQYIDEGWTQKWDNQSKVAVLYRGDQWANYDNFQSMEAKIAYIKEEELGGFMLWEVSLDDFSGEYCRKGKNPALTTLYDAMQRARDNCSPGSRGIVDQHGCFRCPHGFYQEKWAQTSCLPCPQDFSTEDSGTDKMYKCRKFCPAGNEYNYITQTCDACLLDYFRLDTIQHFCHRCDPGAVTTNTGSQTCVPLPVGAPTRKVELTTITVQMEFKVKSCENEDILISAISNNVVDIMLDLNMTWNWVCRGGCANVNTTSIKSCVINEDGTGVMEIYTTINKIPEELESIDNNGQNVTRRAASVLRNRLFDRSQFSELVMYGLEMNGVTEMTTQLVCKQTGYIVINDECEPCSPGMYHDSMTGTCSPCPIGHFQEHLGQSSCSPCTDNKTTTSNGSIDEQDCIDKCSKGTYWDVNRFSCRLCDVGSYQNLIGQMRCIKCPSTMTTKSDGAVTQLKCIDLCDIGTYITSGSNICHLCPVGTYQNVSGQAMCRDCPVSMTTRNKGSKDKVDCIPLCNEVNFCGLNGVCKWSSATSGVYCLCSEGYHGQRCEVKSMYPSDVLPLMGGIVGGSLAVVFVLFIVILIVSCYMCQKLRWLGTSSVYRFHDGEVKTGVSLRQYQETQEWKKTDLNI